MCVLGITLILQIKLLASLSVTNKFSNELSIKDVIPTQRVKDNVRLTFVLHDKVCLLSLLIISEEKSLYRLTESK